MNVGDRIEDLRKKQGMTQEQLAQKIGATRQAVSKWESGKSYPDIDYVVRMGECFGVTTDYLLRGVEDIKQETVQPVPQMNKDQILKIIFTVAIIVGVCICLLLPLVANLYRDWVFHPRGRCHTNPYLYLLEWPLQGIVWMGIGPIIIGWGGMVRIRRKRKDLPPLHKAIWADIKETFTPFS